MRRFILCVVYLAVIGCMSFVIGRILPKFLFNESLFPYRLYSFEKNGDIYNRIKIKSWQNKLPDMSKVLPLIMPEKSIKNTSPEALYRMVQETCVAEFIHAWLAVLGFVCVFIWKGIGGFIVSFLFLIGNLPFILIQRYNRPRLLRVFKNSLKKEARKNSFAKVLLLSCNTGEGHNSCAFAVKEEYESRGVYCVKSDALTFISKDFSVFVSRGHTFMYRKFPALFSFIYRLFEKYTALMHSGSFVDRVFSRGSENLALYIKAGGFDTVVCTHIFAAKILSNAVSSYGLTCKCAFISTDYAYCPGADSITVDHFFTPDDTVSFQFANHGIPKSKIITSGIPVKQAFFTKQNSVSLYENDKVHALLLNGSMGCGDTKKLVSMLSKIDSADFSLTVVCGTNNKLKKSLDKCVALRDNIRVLGYVDNMSALMDSANILITKPGGITVTEAFVKRLPMLLIDAVKGCESYNLESFVSRGAAIDADNVNEAARIVKMLCAVPETLSDIKNNIPFAPVSPSSIIFETLFSKEEESNERSKQAVAAF